MRCPALIHALLLPGGDELSLISRDLESFKQIFPLDPGQLHHFPSAALRRPILTHLVVVLRRRLLENLDIEPALQLAAKDRVLGEHDSADRHHPRDQPPRILCADRYWTMLLYYITDRY